jgi:hypothetical protein
MGGEGGGGAVIVVEIPRLTLPEDGAECMARKGDGKDEHGVEYNVLDA